MDVHDVASCDHTLKLSESPGVVWGSVNVYTFPDFIFCAQVFTIEPGLYFQTNDESVPKEFDHFRTDRN